MASKNKKGVERKEYPKLIKVGDKKVRVLNPMEEAQLNNVNAVKEEKDKKGW